MKKSYQKKDLKSSIYILLLCSSNILVMHVPGEPLSLVKRNGKVIQKLYEPYLILTVLEYSLRGARVFFHRLLHLNRIYLKIQHVSSAYMLTCWQPQTCENNKTFTLMRQRGALNSSLNTNESSSSTSLPFGNYRRPAYDFNNSIYITS